MTDVSVCDCDDGVKKNELFGLSVCELHAETHGGAFLPTITTKRQDANMKDEMM